MSHFQPPHQSPHTIDVEAEDQRIVEEEWARYLADGIITDEEELADLKRPVVRPYQCFISPLQTSKRKYKLLYCFALDVLPVQASSVLCELLFSSSKETDTLRRSNLSPRMILMIEMLQILKFSYRSERLDFNNGWVSKEAELSVIDTSIPHRTPFINLVLNKYN